MNTLKDYALSYLNESSVVANMASISTDSGFNNAIMEITERVWDFIVVKDIVGIQPMTGPVGVYFSIRYYSGQSYNGTAGSKELGYNIIDPNYSTTTEVIGSNAVSDVGTSPDEYPGINGGLGVGTGRGTRELNFKIEKRTATVKTKKLRARFSYELLQDVVNMHNINLRQNIIDAIAREIAAEIDEEILEYMETKATQVTLDFNNVCAGSTIETDIYHSFVAYLTQSATRIGTRVQNGTGNYAIASPRICAALEATQMFSISANDKADDMVATKNCFYAGELNNIKLYCNFRWTTDKMIVGHKGPTELDAGIFYLPYTFVTMSTVLADSFQEEVGAMSRFAIGDSCYGPENYYEKITITNFR